MRQTILLCMHNIELEIYSTRSRRKTKTFRERVNWRKSSIRSTRLYRFLPSRVQEAVKDGGQEIVKISVFTLIRVITFNVRVKNRALRSWRR